MKIHVHNNVAIAPVGFDSVVISVLPRLEGRKKWVKDMGLQFEASTFNLRLFQDELGAEIVDHRPKLLPSRYVKQYTQKTSPLPHQLLAIEAAKEKDNFALWMDVGTGKSWLAIYLMGLRYVNKLITGVIVISPKGVHTQWIAEQIPEHINVPWRGTVWENKKSVLDEINRPCDKALDILSIHIDGIVSPKSEPALKSFIEKHKGKLFIVLDEADMIKNYASKRHARLEEFREAARYRLEMTGTPAPLNLIDIWSQFLWLDPNILGMETVTAFKREFCIFGGFRNRDIIGYRDIARFKKLIDPYNFTVTSAEVGVLPPAEVRWRFNMADDQRKAYDDIKDRLIVELEEGSDISVPDTAVKFLRLQQVASGFLMHKGENIKTFQNPRLDALSEVIEAREPKKATIWCRFHHDIDQIMGLLGEGAVEYSGRTDDYSRRKAIDAFLDPKSNIRFFVATAAAGGVGLNLQGDALLSVFYTNTYSARDRWQAIGRTSRLGAKGRVEIVDLMCRNSTDNGIITNLRRKRNIQDIATKELINMLKNGEDGDYDYS
jgi:hypothetical protein